MDEPTLLATLARAPRLDAQALRAASAAAGGLHSLLGLRTAALTALGLAPESAAWIACPDVQTVAADRRWLKSSGVQLIGATAAEYPPLLAATAGAPAVLYVRGNPEVLATPQLAMVGSRHASAQGRSNAREFAKFFAQSGLAITSGLALGVDAASHAGALAAGGRTLAVCGTGLDVVYPPEHIQLAHAIVDGGGALLSEYPPGTAPLGANFLRRHRIISALALGVLVVEAARESGSLQVARHAAEQGREVFAIPGSIHSPLSRGCHQLIREGAKLVEDAADVLGELAAPLRRYLADSEKHDINQSSENTPEAAGDAGQLDKEYKILLDALGFEPTSVDDVAERTGLPTGSVASMLLILELDGRIRAHPGGRYGRVHRNS
jgi:DNA processing protein